MSAGSSNSGQLTSIDLCTKRGRLSGFAASFTSDEGDQKTFQFGHYPDANADCERTNLSQEAAVLVGFQMFADELGLLQGFRLMDEAGLNSDFVAKRGSEGTAARELEM